MGWVYLLAALLFAAPEKMYLLDLSKKPVGVSVDPSATKIPNRVYLFHVPALKRMAQVLTNENGKFAEPTEVLAENTVLWGYMVGAPEPSSHYKLLANGDWKKTAESIQRRFWRLGKKLAYQNETSRPVPPSEVPGVSLSQR